MSLTGLLDLPWWGYVVVSLLGTHMTIVSVTLYLHRHSAHRALDLHPLAAHVFRFWLWFTTGMVTKQWTAIHRKHHARCETEEDPHSPQVMGIRKVLLEGAELYRAEGKNKETLDKFGKGTPDDWIERHVYTPHSAKGIALLALLYILLFGPYGIIMWAVHMIWIPFWAAGIINGVGHYIGYRNFDSDDASTNVSPWGILIGGEELHNNHHAFGTSAKFSSKWYEFDIGWMYIQILSFLGLATVRKVAPKPRTVPMREVCDLENLQAIIANRYHVTSNYAKAVRDLCSDELDKLRASPQLRSWLLSDQRKLTAAERAQLADILRQSPVLEKVHGMRQELTLLWERSTTSTEQMVRQLQDWCSRAESSNIQPLQSFSRSLRCYA